MTLLFKRSFLSCLLLSAIAVLGPTVSWSQEAAAPAPAAAQKGNLSSAVLAPKIVEDYSTPALTATTKLKSIPALDIQVDKDDPQFTRTITRVQWRAGDDIDLYVIRPVGVKKPPVVIYLYDYPSETEAFLKRDVCRWLVKDGFAAVGFVPALTGQRYHDRPMKEWFVSEMPEALAGTAHDVQMVLNYLADHGEFDMSHVGFYGEGSGATIGILAAAVDPRIQTLDLVNPWGDWPDWVAQSTRIPEKERPNFQKPEYLAKVAPLDPLKWLPQLKTPNIRLQNVRSFEETPVPVQKKIEAAAPANAQVLPFDNANAYLSAIPIDQRLDWIKKQMRAKSAQEFQAEGNRAARNASSKSADAKRD